jgi:DNA-binding response OmpR family regulator
MVVDDNKDIRDLLSEALCEYGYEVVVAGCGAEGWSLFRQSIVDLVVTDYQMPEIDGWQLSKLIKRRSPRTPIIMITGQAIDETQVNFQQVYIDFLIHKPFKLENLYETVHVFLHHHFIDNSPQNTSVKHSC